MVKSGMSLDEVDRMKVTKVKWLKNHYPLIFDIPKRRYECLLVIEDFGLPPPSQSSCWMCPNITNCEWQEIKVHDPADFEQAITFEKQISSADEQGGLWLHQSKTPLSEADFTNASKSYPLFDCAEGCFT